MPAHARRMSSTYANYIVYPQNRERKRASLIGKIPYSIKHGTFNWGSSAYLILVISSSVRQFLVMPLYMLKTEASITSLVSSRFEAIVESINL